MRTKEQIFTQIMDSVAADNTLSTNLNSASATAIYKLWAYVVTYAIFTFELILDTFKVDIEALLLALKPHTLYWYTQKAKVFQLGYNLPAFEENYDNSALTDAQVSASKIVTQASCMKALRQNGSQYIRLKIAKGTLPSLAKLTTTELDAFRDYMNQIQDAGVDLSCESRDADEMYMSWTVWYNPQLIDSSGNSIVDGTPVVRNAIEKFLTDLPFNGRYVPDMHKAYIHHNVPGVDVANIDLVEFRSSGSNVSISPPPNGSVPDAGWMKFYNPSDLTITFIANE